MPAHRLLTEPEGIIPGRISPAAAAAPRVAQRTPAPGGRESRRAGSGSRPVGLQRRGEPVLGDQEIDPWVGAAYGVPLLASRANARPCASQGTGTPGLARWFLAWVS